ncbi:T9SS type A sorting domain-containing protein [Pseudoflavitalea sp. G-6-1-2]|uniref:T9SS type A sorting domain-containing protein n=1 Tax=Pseudoflavitalea sp. G-6-1-2 TaxID=2728841 RepID=UPI00146CE4DA|nr:T9SS type A sorting domain-containing protein [Pseudoflavitalea sp. G-6-1-2]NML22992.1 T9SS type A sorting domain-containing protein [Pseudoflavitalea sp. G-6-1-2]
MSRIFKNITALLICLIAGKAYSQCGDYSGNLNDLPVCGSYGDANGVSNWKWEITDVNDPDYCKMWYARTSNTSNKTAMGSPFVNATTQSLDAISKDKDFTKAKGWELLRREFGCDKVVAYPYFILYNKYNGMMRIFVYQPESQTSYSGIMLQMEPTTFSYPATTAFGDIPSAATDKFLANPNTYGKMVVAVGEPGGSSRWTMAEYNMAFDPNIQNAVYNGSRLSIKIFGIIVSEIKSKITGTSITSNQPISNFSYKPASSPTTSDNLSYEFKTAGERFTSFSKNISGFRSSLNKAATDVSNALNGAAASSGLGKIRNFAEKIKSISSTDGALGQSMDQFSKGLKGFGGALNLVGSVIGMFESGGGGPSAAPTYTSYNLELTGTLTSKIIINTLILAIPGTNQPDNNNATYYRCPLGILNLKTTPVLEKVAYNRYCGISYGFDGREYENRKSYISYRVKNNLDLSFNASFGLELVSAEAALVGEVKPTTVNGVVKASYNPFKPHNNGSGSLDAYDFNHMLADFESERLEISNFDTEKELHTFQTPFVPLGCFKGRAMTVRFTTNVYVRVRAVLKKANDPTAKPIFVVKDFLVDIDPNSIPANQGYEGSSIEVMPPYANYTLPFPARYDGNMDVNAPLFPFNTTKIYDGEYRSVFSIVSPATTRPIIVEAGQNILFRAGGEVTLKPGFEVRYGAEFMVSNDFGQRLSCETVNAEAYQNPSNCYNTSITALRLAPENAEAGPVPAAGLKVFPSLSKGTVNITSDNLRNANIIVADQSGRVVHSQLIRSDSRQVELHLQHLTNGLYFIKVNAGGKITTTKVMISK